MPFNFGEVINNVKHTIVNNDVFYSLVSNPVYISILIVAIILIIVTIVYDTDKLMYSLFKIGVYSIIITLICLLFHDNSIKIKYTTNTNEDFHTDVVMGKGEDFQIIPNNNNENTHILLNSGIENSQGGWNLPN